MIDLQHADGLAELTIRHEKELNPFSIEMTRQLTQLCQSVESDDSVRGVLIWGGAGRSFSVGGDFASIKQLRTHGEVGAYLKDIVRSYQAVLEISKPVVAAVDGYAIGQGLQVALMADWRVGSNRVRCQMPELENGVACPLGSLILETLLGRAAMMQLVIGCRQLDAQEAVSYRLIDELKPSEELKSAALERLSKICGFPAESFRLTKQIHNARLSEKLENVLETAANAHAASFMGKSADKHFSEILGEPR